MTDDRFRLLVEKYLEGLLTEDEARELVESGDPRLLDEVLLAGLLERVYRKSIDLAPKVQAALRAPADRAAMVEKVLHRLPRRRRVGPWIGAAAVALAAVGVYFVRPREPVERIPALVRKPTPVDLAVEKGVAFLRAVPPPPSTHAGPMPPDDLICFALAHAGVPASDPLFTKHLDAVLAAKLQRTYVVSLQAMLLEKLDRVKYRGRILQCAKFLIDNQCVNGQWSYGEDAPVPSPALTGNNSCSLFAAFGLRACADAGVPIPRGTLDRAARWWRECRRAYPDVGDGEVAGWCYTREESPHRPYGSMTAGAVAALVIEDSLLGEDWRKDAVVRAGLRWLNKYFSPSENFGPVEDLMAREVVSDTPNPKTELYYYLWAVERAAGATGLATLGGHDWYAEGVREILAAQRADGSWFGGAKRCQPVYDTCFAILFLARSTRSF